MPFDPEAYGGSLAEQQAQRLDAAYEEMNSRDRAAAAEVAREVDLMTEARTRFAKAALYEQIIEGMIFEGDDAVTLEVENEFKAFAEERLRVLLGMEGNLKRPEASFEEDELNVLKAWANKMLGRVASIPRPEAPVQPKLATMRPAPPVAPPQGTLSAPKRGRGRPPGTGKHQIARAAAEQNGQLPPSRRADPQAKQVMMPNGVVGTITPQRGRVKPQQGAASDPKPLPMPSPDEMIGMAMEQGEAGYKAQGPKWREEAEKI